MTDYTQAPQYKAAAQSVWDLLKEVRDGNRLDPLIGDVTVALSNLAVAEAIHRVAAAVERLPYEP